MELRIREAPVMWTSFSPRRLVRDVLAILFAASTTTYSALWVIQNKHTTPQPGFTNYEYSDCHAHNERRRGDSGQFR